ncbi:MAG: LysR family transcriptional regulator [Lachnospiraceae bacterium]|nr:LysR family transcriptional regulator [Lachnospiraceae bacterium]
MEQNLNYYKIFFEVAKAGNISKAAELLYISQPAVSKSITKLEQSLGHTLFIRSKRGVKLTEEGETLFSHLKLAFDAIHTAEQTLKRVSKLGLGQLRIGVSTSLCKHILLPYLQDYIEENPHVKVSIECNPTFQTLQLLKQDKIDIGLICDTPLEKGYHFTSLRSIHDIFVTTQTYLDNLNLRELDTTDSPALPDIPNMTGLLFFTDNAMETGQGNTMTTKEILEKSNLMLLDKENISRIFIDEYMAGSHIEPGHILEINNMDLLIDFASIGMGVACVVREFVNSYLQDGQVIELPMEIPIPKRTIGFVYPEHGMNLTARKFLDSCFANNTAAAPSQT